MVKGGSEERRVVGGMVGVCGRWWMYSVLLEFSTIVSGRFVHQIRAYIKQAQQTKTLSMRAVPADRSANEHESGREVA